LFLRDDLANEKVLRFEVGRTAIKKRNVYAALLFLFATAILKVMYVDEAMHQATRSMRGI
jgi:hypothetical protein